MATFLQTFDLRTTTHAQVVEAVRVFEAQGFKVTTHRYSDQTIDLFLVDEHPDTLPGFTNFAIKLGKEVRDVNKMASNITGASFLGDQFRTQLALVKADLADAGTQMGKAMTELRDTASQATETVKQIKAETADLKAALGLTSNGGPSVT